jgi:hypothetical protein
MSDVKSSVLSKNNSFIRASDFSDVGNSASVRQALSRLRREGDLTSIRDGLYWRGAKTKFGRRQPDALRVAQAIVGRDGVGYAGMSAANALGLTSHVPGTFEIAVPKRSPSPLSNIRFISRAARDDRRRARLNTMEVGLLETLEAWEEVVDAPYEWAVDWLGKLFDNETLSAEKLAKASGTESARTRERLRNLLSELGYDEEASRIRHAADSSERFLITA